MVWDEFLCGEGAEVVQVGVQRRSQGRALEDQPDSRMTPTVDSPLMAFGLAEPPFQVQIVPRQFIHRAQKQPRQKSDHQPRHVLRQRIALAGEASLEFLKLAAAVLLRASGRIERVGHGLDLLYLRSQFVLSVLDGLQPAVNAGR